MGLDEKIWGVGEGQDQKSQMEPWEPGIEAAGRGREVRGREKSCSERTRSSGEGGRVIAAKGGTNSEVWAVCRVKAG